MHFISGLLERIFLIVGAFIGIQVPQFMHQYLQQLKARLAELDHLLEKLNQLALLSNKTLDQYIQKFLANSDSDFVRQGEFMHQLVARWQTLSTSLNQLQSTNAFERPFVFIHTMNSELADSTWKNFEPGLSFTLEGLCYCAAGALISFIVFKIILITLTTCCQFVWTQISSLKKREG